MDVKELRAVLELGSRENYTLWFVDDDGEQWPVASAELDDESRTLVLKGVTV